MKRKSYLWLSLCLLMLAGCSSEDDSSNYEQDILGYWEYVGEGAYPAGLLFLPNGEIKSWAVFELYDDHSDYKGEYSWGHYWFDDSGKLQIKEGSKEPNPDELYYTVMSLTKDRLVIRVYGGFAGTPFGEGEDRVYQKKTGLYTL